MSINNNTTRLNKLIQVIDALPDKNTGVELPELTNPASEAEVFSGKEYIDDNGNKKTGSFSIDAEISRQDTLIAQIQSALQGKSASGESLDTSDATATANDMAEGVTAYVNGEKITGTVRVVDTNTIVSATILGIRDSVNGYVFRTYANINRDYLYRNGITEFIDIPAEQLGDATTADVVTGKTFTSTNGLKVTGTGNLIPSTISKIAAGSFTPTSDITSYNIIPGFDANFYYVWLEETVSANSHTGYIVYQNIAPVGYNNGTNNKYSGVSATGYSSSTYPITLSVLYGNVGAFTGGIPLYGDSNCKFKANSTYYWICGVLSYE